MGLPSELINQFVKITNDSNNTVEETTVYGTIVEHEGSKYVQLDGSELLTPITTAANVEPGDRVTVMIKNHTATVTGNLTSPAARTAEVEKNASQISEFEIVLADKVDVKDLTAERARIDELIAKDVEITGSLKAAEADIETLRAGNVTITGRLDAVDATIENLDVDKFDAKYAQIKDLEAIDAKIYNLDATYAKITDLEATYAKITDLEATNAEIGKLDATYAKISDLEATNANIGNLKADVADIDTLIFGSASGDVIQSEFANAVIAQLGDAQIKDAMIESVFAGKITAGDIITDKVRVVSDDGKLLISDETIQISDDNRVRVQIGKDAANDYSINIWDANGKLMFSEGGITDSAIKEAIIRNDMVSDDANISAEKLDISSLFGVINDDGSHTLNASKILVDANKQTLEASFKTMTDNISAVQKVATDNAADMAALVTKFNADIENLQGQIDGSITTWFYEVPPTADNEPTVNWTTPELKNNHLGDLYYDTVTGYCYRYQIQNNEYSWQRVTDTEVAEALERAKTAQDTADSKRRVFYATPTPPYDAGDLWVQGSEGDILRCQTSKPSGQSYNASDWVVASKYTDDTTANDAKQKAENAQNTANTNATNIGTLTNTVTSQGTDISVIQGQLSSRVWQQDIEAAYANVTSISLSNSNYEYYKLSGFHTFGFGEFVEFMLYSRGGESIKVNISSTDASYLASAVRMSNAYSKIMEIWYLPSENAVYTKMAAWANTLGIRVLANSKGSGNGTITKIGSIPSNATRITIVENADSTDITNLSGDITTLTTRYSSLEQDVDSITATVASHTTQISNKADSGTVTAVTDKVSKLETDLSGFRTTVSDTYATKASLNTTDGKVTAAQNAVNELASTVTTSYATKSELNQTSNSITASVSATYATKTDLSNTDTKATNAGAAAQEAQKDVDALTESVQKTYATKSEVQQTANSITSTVSQTYTTKTDFSNFETSTGEDIDSVNALLDETGERVGAAESRIQQLADSIVTLVVDDNGSSRIEHTSTGWTFGIDNMQSVVDKTSEDLVNLTEKVEGVNGTVSEVQKSVEGLTAYVRIGETDDSKPFIELGENDSDFRLVITNEDIQFMEGSSVPAYINNQSLHIKKAVIEEELQQGEFVWKARSNGNLGLMWKGVNG